MRPISYKDKKRMYAFIVVAIIMIAALLYLRFVLGTD
ncbi:MAG: hypothetical protein UR34_C0010G0025 [candidate division WS6 bacterium GW2011_GWC1_33_20]|uniref:Uncharacterized protein n=1 Tax=candidate division WS6 bacterium GW2011_GWC1_33_20 TaxID=1619089 RepID=A0A0G0BYA8_9BACT|nr:MAG: hypothetical protein UR32_C0019G0013 [candidate division WS6 bacterium GW2011_GWE2_33_157]KKP43860.1 MAG: hypothetical protein UR34_C0010G0025 [candidate division WS6 bacterium GW2011_GWC1_33_20]KKP44349.1 MAG: hypothetical protein UR36_C0018G0014 [candidate division WS6 bacterium GW2011_GWF1_33_233]KKP54834.1 MAG: hypothetical protein UR45_C0008G0012 [candidate division WS6 bacterium GW2011_WS6_33_547]